MTRCGFRSSRGAVLGLGCALLACAWAGCASAPPAGTVSPPSPSTRAEEQTASGTYPSAADGRQSPASEREAATVPDAAADAAGDTPAAPGDARPTTGTGLILGPPTGTPAAPDRPAEDLSGNSTGSSVAPAGTTSLGAPSANPESGATAGGLVLRLSAGPAVLRVGDQVTVEVRATASARVVDAPLHLVYDATRLRYVAGEEGDFLKRDGSGTVFLINGRSQPGVVTIGLGRLDRSHGLSGAGTHCRVRFEAIAPGQSRVAVGQAMAWADDGAMLPVGTDAIIISVPEP